MGQPRRSVAKKAKQFAKSEAIAKTEWARRRAAALRMRGKLADRIPNHVKQCWHNGGRSWWIFAWKKGIPAAARRSPYTCKSWRCETCRRYDASVNFARISEAAGLLSAEGWLFLTLTMERRGEREWYDVDAAYKAIGRMSRTFMKRLRRWQEANGQESLGSQWVGVIEAHRSGWPHYHVMLHSDDLAAYVAGNPQQNNFLPPELANHAQACGWGRVSTLEVAQSSAAIAGYLTKLSGEQDSLTGELAKMTQLPTVAPVRFRRLRSGKGFLPPRRKNTEYTGTLVRRRADGNGFAHVEPLFRTADNPLVQALCDWEEREWSRVCNLRVPDVPQTSIMLVWRDGNGTCPTDSAGERNSVGSAEGMGLPSCPQAWLLSEREPQTLSLTVNTPPTI